MNSSENVGESGEIDARTRALLEDLILKYVQDRHCGIEAAAELTVETFRRSVPRPVVFTVARQLEKAQADITLMPAVVDSGSYPSSDPFLEPPASPQWSAYIERLREKGAPGLDELDKTTSDVVKLLARPYRSGSKRKGLVMGNVQSGKTRHFSGVVAKAMDEGYRFVIVLSGMNNNLREQTQSRLDHDLFPDQQVWRRLTTTGDNDFSGDSQLTSLLGKESRLLLCAVIKKNKTRLTALKQSLAKVPVQIRRSCPILIIDDEADQATPNSQSDKDKISAINQCLRDLWKLIITGSYVAYTATPFANVLMDPDNEEELFPSDFIYSLDPGDGYFGAERVFGLTDDDPDRPSQTHDGLDLVRTIDDGQDLIPPSGRANRENFDPSLPPSLDAAVAWFIDATAVRRIRGQLDHSSMLVHTTHYSMPHFAMQGRLQKLLRTMRDEVKARNWRRFQAAWDRESGKVPPLPPLTMPSWEQVRDRIPEVLQQVEVIVDNSKSEDRLNYDDGPKTVIAVGGGTLSRGLTLEGLVVSYFTRTSNTYDTLMQMGRWFGYRPGYEDLPRIWVTTGLDDDYAFLAAVEKELRQEIHSLQASEFTPKEVGLKIRTHPGRLNITGPGKMGHARIVQVSLSGVRQQTFLLDGRSEAVAHNRRAVEELLRCGRGEALPWLRSRHIVRGVPASAIASFIGTFSFQPDLKVFSEDRRAVAQEWLLGPARDFTWNVILAGNSNPDASHALGITHINDLEAPMVSRAPLAGSRLARLNFKAIMSPADRLADINPKDFKGLAHENEPDRIRARRMKGHHQGLVVIYPISPCSATTLDSRIDMPAGVDDALLGFGIVFPDIDTAVKNGPTYVSVRPNPAEVIDESEDEDEDLEEE